MTESDAFSYYVMRDIDTNEPIMLLRRPPSGRPVQAFRRSSGWVLAVEGERYFLKGDVNEEDAVTPAEAEDIIAGWRAKQIDQRD